MNIQAVIIDPQRDFTSPNGSLFVAGADQDMIRAANMIDRIGGSLSKIHITLDSHNLMDVAHPLWWKSCTDGSHPAPFTIISTDDVRNGVWTTTLPTLYDRSLEYVEALEAGGKFPLCVWPPHCIIGSYGACIDENLLPAIHSWENKYAKIANKITKGSNPFTEHYSAIKAEVPDPKDNGTKINSNFINILEEADMILLLGEASSHCLAQTGIDIADNFADESYIKKLVYITDCASPVTGFESASDDFLTNMTARGMQTATSTDILS
jgi:nicotinamidase-related amidase